MLRLTSIHLGAAFLLALAAAGCGDDESPPATVDAATPVADAGAPDHAADTATDVAPDAGTPDVLASDALPADASPAEIAAFVGEWLVTSGDAQATMCSGLPDLPAQSLADKMVTVSPGTDSALELTLAGCTFKLDVSGNVATARPGQSCMTTLDVSGLTFQVTLTFDSSTFTVTDGTGSLVQTGHASAQSPIAVMCTYKANATGMKVVPTDGGADAQADAQAVDAAGDSAATADASTDLAQPDSGS
jgi:hypothetical protein